MKIILFAHPKFLGSQSMPRYAKMLADGMQLKGHEVEIWEPNQFFFKIPFSALKKWMSYVDQYIVFPFQVNRKIRKLSRGTLFVFTDQALGPWVPLVSDQPHVVHCHDFLALKSALDNIPENPTSSTGKIYQKYIRSGFSKGKNFISISQKTQDDLHELHHGTINSSVVCYNGLNREFKVLDVVSCRDSLGKYLDIDLSRGYILHIGGNQFYKNRKGVIEIYNAWRNSAAIALPLIMIGARPTAKLNTIFQNSEYKKDIHWVTGLGDEYINIAYSGATCFLFPSLDEGFGWPIAEAMASGCPVITTNRAPMTEVVGSADFFLIDRRPFEEALVKQWAIKASRQISTILSLSEAERSDCIAAGIVSTKRFHTASFINEIEAHYTSLLAKN